MVRWLHRSSWFGRDSSNKSLTLLYSHSLHTLTDWLQKVCFQNVTKWFCYKFGAINHYLRIIWSRILAFLKLRAWICMQLFLCSREIFHIEPNRLSFQLHFSRLFFPWSWSETEADVYQGRQGVWLSLIQFHKTRCKENNLHGTRFVWPGPQWPGINPTSWHKSNTSTCIGQFRQKTLQCPHSSAQFFPLSERASTLQRKCRRGILLSLSPSFSRNCLFPKQNHSHF